MFRHMVEGLGEGRRIPRPRVQRRNFPPPLALCAPRGLVKLGKQGAYMTGIDAFRAGRSLLLAMLLLVLVPSAASAVTANGGLQQLAAPNDCVSSNPGTTCGTVVNGGLGNARSIAITPGGANAYVASTA